MVLSEGISDRGVDFLDLLDTSLNLLDFFSNIELIGFMVSINNTRI